MAGAEEPATLSGFRHAMARTMVGYGEESGWRTLIGRVERWNGQRFATASLIPHEPMGGGPATPTRRLSFPSGEDAIPVPNSHNLLSLLLYGLLLYVGRGMICCSRSRQWQRSNDRCVRPRAEADRGAKGEVRSDYG